MHWQRCDATSLRRAETGVLLMAAVSFALLLPRAIEVSPIVGALALGVGLPLVVLRLAAAARERGSHRLHMAIFMFLLGGMGLLIGAGLDFGPIGLVTLAAWCSLYAGFSLDAALGKIAVAPWTYAGMWVGCNLGMVLSRFFLRAPQPARGIGWLRYFVCNLGMIVGMFAVEGWMGSATSSGTGLSSVTAMMLFMGGGMALGMWLGSWSLDRLRQGLEGANRT